MEMVILTNEEFYAKIEPYDLYIPEDEATEAFWSTFDKAEAMLRTHLARLGPENTSWELPGHSQRSRVLYSYIYADSLYTPELLRGIAEAIPSDGHPWCAELECHSNARILPGGRPLCLGWAAIIHNTFYTSSDFHELIAYAPRLGLQLTES